MKKNALPEAKTEAAGSQAEKKHIEYGRCLYQIFLAVVLCALLCTPAFVATDMWTKAKEIMNSAYTQILGISTIAAVVTASVALLLMNFSKNGRTVDESRAWLKRIVITWAIINGLGFIMAWVAPFFQGGAVHSVRNQRQRNGGRASMLPVHSDYLRKAGGKSSAF